MDLCFVSCYIHCVFDVRCAISLGIVTDFVGTKEKIEAGYELKNHVERAIEIDPNQAVLHYMKGRWSYGQFLCFFIFWISNRFTLNSSQQPCYLLLPSTTWDPTTLLAFVSLLKFYAQQCPEAFKLH